MNYRRLFSGYRCQRNRGKTHYQIAMESLVNFIGPSRLSSTLMSSSFERHGLGGGLWPLEEILKRLPPCSERFARDTIFTGGFFIDTSNKEVWATYRAAFADKIQAVIEDADRVCRHEFRFLGATFSYSDKPIDWHLDPVSGYRWPKKLFSELKRNGLGRDRSDIKLPWELSRMQHLPTLGKAYRLTKDLRYASEIVEQVSHWMDDNPCPYGVNWTCPMDVAIRIMNITWGYQFVRDAEVVTNQFRLRLARSTFHHAQFILFNLEYGLRDDGSIANGNHYLTNVVGLLHLGLLCPEFKMAEKWRSIGVNGLLEEMDRQVYSDGVNFESSIAYHRLVLELFTAGALLCRANGVTLPEKFWKRLERMYEFVLYVTRPDGNIPMVGDADDGRLYILSDYGDWYRSDFRYLLSIGAVLFHRPDMEAHSAAVSEEAFWLLGPPAMSDFARLTHNGNPLESNAFRDSGLYIMRQQDNYLLACCGKVGTQGLGNHKHNDLLSFELYARDKPFIVDPGTYVYTRDPELRNIFRSTAYHNTVVIDGEEQNRFNPAELFRMRADANVTVQEWISTPDLDRLVAEHTGYMRLDQPVRHRRTFQFHKRTARWEIIDGLTGNGRHTADWYFHFDSGVDLEPTREHTFRTRCEGTNLEIMAHAEIPLVFQIENGWVSRRYGHKLPSKVFHITASFNAACRIVITIQTV
jgi:Heparinase II/III-like protein/Heparinase II/III N-terminus